MGCFRGRINRPETFALFCDITASFLQAIDFASQDRAQGQIELPVARLR